MKDIRLKKLANLLVNYSTNVKPGDFVLVECDTVAEPFMVEVFKEAIKAGAHVETLLDSEEVVNAKLKYSSEEQLKEESFIMKNVLDKADVWITVWAHRNTKNNSNISSDKIKFSLKGAESWRKIYSEKTGNGSLRWVGTQYPTYSDAQEASMSLEDYEDFVYRAGLLDKEEPIKKWQVISKEQEKWVKYLDNKKELHFISEGTDITINVEGRKWINCDGKVNFPDGEIFTSPVEEGINGYITFSFPGVYMGKDIEGIRLEVKNGKVIKAEADKGEELLNSLIKIDEGACRFGEVAIGTNYGIKKFTRNMLFDEKIGGTIHMALGDSMPEAGGKLFYENGKFIDSIICKD